MSDTEKEVPKEEVPAEEANSKPETMEAQMRRRITEAVAEEIRQLVIYSVRAKREGHHQAHCQALESIASVKAKVEVYCLQVEMAVKTAAMASTLGAIMRDKAQPAQGARPDPAAIMDLAAKAARPGRKVVSDQNKNSEKEER